jgi:serine/threonine protein kinase
MDILSLFSRGENLVQVTLGEKILHEDESSHQDLIRLLAIASALSVEIFPFTWQPALESLGQGGTGWISQSSVNDQISFAFKRFQQVNPNPNSELTESKFRSLQFNAMISEIVVLSCPEVYDHPNIINLEGICWEVLKPSGEVWPVLVFQKAKLGDLRRTLSLPESENMDLNMKIGICGEVAKALRIMHQCGKFYEYYIVKLLVAHGIIIIGIIHGDMRPENVLVTKSQDDASWGVHVTDFGYSSYETLVKVPRSPPWEAPEWHPRWFNLENAKRMDVYSFGLLCLWLVFSGEHLQFIDCPSINIDLAFLVWQENHQLNPMTKSLKDMKASGKLLDSVLHLLSQKQDIAEQTRSCLEEVFTLALSHNPKKRAGQMDVFVDLLCDSKNLVFVFSNSQEINISA